MNSVLNSLSWAFSGKISKNLITFLITVFLARLLSPSDFGIIAIVTGFTAIANILADFGMSSAIIQMDEKDIDSDLLSSVFWLNLLIASLFGFLIYLASGFIANFYLNNQLNVLIKLASLVFVINGFSTLHTALFKKKGDFKKISLSKIYASFISGLIAITFAFLGFGVYSLIFGIIFDSFFYSIFIWSKKTFMPKFYLSFKRLKSVFGFSIKVFASRIFEEFINQIDYLIIGKIVNFNVLGFFQRGKSLSTLSGRYASESVLYVMFPILSNIKNDKEVFKKKCFKTFSIITFGCFFLATLLFNSAYEIIDLIYGPKWLSTLPYFSILMIYSIVFPINRILTTFLKSIGDGSNYLSVFMFQKTEAIIAIVILFLTKSLDLYLYSIVLLGYIMVVISIFYVTRILNFKTRMFLMEFFKTLLCSIIIVLIVSFCKEFFIFNNSLLKLIQNLILTVILFMSIALLFNLKSRDYLLQIIMSSYRKFTKK